MQFIYIKDDAMSPKQCERCIKFFELNKNKIIHGTTGSKHSYDLHKNFLDEDAVDVMILDILNKGTAEYKKLYPSIEELPDAWNVYRGYNIQKYDPGGGFKDWHCETGDFKNYPVSAACRRMLVWMIYLNDVPDGGTDFREQNWTCEAKRGRLVIWPASWTHTHKSHISPTTTKYIATGWYTFNLP
jgi:hypothetical protein|tara:strand:+ start:5087 stop:5644 length:558 start_codon:yes stop_codon:yes gene_type:complete